MAQPGFTLGDHTFLHPSQPGPLSRFKAKKKQIRGAPPPSVFEGIVREATATTAAAKNLLKGKFCGHGEPTMTVFEVVIDGVDELEFCYALDPLDADNERNLPLIVVRKPGDTAWTTLFRREWEDRGEGLEGVAQAPLSQADLVSLSEDGSTGRVAVGFEYPCDADSKDAVSWMTIDLLVESEKAPVSVLSAELS